MREIDKSEVIVLHRAQQVKVVSEDETVSLEFLVACEGRNYQSVLMTIDYDTAFSMIRAITHTMMTRDARPSDESSHRRKTASMSGS